MHLSMGEVKFIGRDGPIWRQSTLCNKLLKSPSKVTTNRNAVTCAKCRRLMDKADAFMRWFATGDDADFRLAHGIKPDACIVGGDSLGVKAEREDWNG